MPPPILTSYDIERLLVVVEDKKRRNWDWLANWLKGYSPEWDTENVILMYEEDNGW